MVYREVDGRWRPDAGVLGDCRPVPYVYLLVIGPHTLTTAVGYGFDQALNPFTYVPRGYGLLTLNEAMYGVAAIDGYAAVLHDLDELNKTALDPYASIRSAYQQSQQSRLAKLRTEHGFTTPRLVLALRRR